MKYVSEKADQASKTLQRMNDQAAVSSEELPFDERSQYCTEVLGLCSLLLICLFLGQVASQVIRSGAILKISCDLANL